MLKRRAILMTVVALGLGLSAAALVNRWVDSRISAESGGDGNAVAVAAREIPFGKALEPMDVRIVRLPDEAAPPGAYEEIESLTGKVATQRIFPGEPLLKARVVEQLAGGVLAASISPKKRAVSVRVNDVVGVAGFLLPGSHVDVLATKRAARNRDAQAETILENLRVLAVDQTASPDKNEPTIVRAVTLEMAPGEAETLVKATQEGTIQLALRNPLDEDVANKEQAQGAGKTQAAGKSRSRRPWYMSVVLIKGTDVSTARVRND